jgi:FixJ family two-component response regulator
MSPGLRQGLVGKSASTVCLLDDDPSVLKATGRLLASAGWEVDRFIDPDRFPALCGDSSSQGSCN